MNRERLDELVSRVRTRYHSGEKFMTAVCNVAHEHWLAFPYDKAESIVRQALVEEFARMKRGLKGMAKCGCGKRGYVAEGNRLLCSECAAKVAASYQQLELFFGGAK